MSSRVVRPDELAGGQRYRLLTSAVVPRPIGWVGTRNVEGRANLAPFSYYMGLSASPMLVGLSIGRRSGGEKDTLLNIRETQSFSVNTVSEAHLESMVRTSGDWPRGVDEFEEAGLAAGACEVIDAPRVLGAPVAFECRLFREVALGNAPNTLVIGRVVAVHLDEALAVDPETFHIDVSSLRPVGRLGLDEYTFLGERRRVERPRVPPPEERA